jgi:sigma-B regulation protein RsbU (phosphoserine phosphatase)
MTLLTASLVEMQDQLIAFYKLARFGQQRVPVRMILGQFARRAAEMFRVESGFCLVASAEWPLIVEHHPKSLLGPQPLQEYVSRIKDGEPMIRWHREENNHSSPSILTSEINNLIVVSVSIHEEGFVALGLVNKGGEGFTVPDIKLAEAFVQNAGAQIENLILYQQAMEQTRLRAEMELAHSVQLNLLPQQSPRVEGLDIWANSRSASQVGGDFYDFSGSPAQPFTFTVGDVSGKGLPAAMLMAMTRVILRTIMQLPVAISPEIIISRAHDALYRDFVHVGMFVTVFVGQYNDVDRELTFANAGHSPVIYCPRGGPARLIGAEGMPMGVLRDVSAREQHLQIRKGDTLVVASDGFHESWNENGEMFGYDRLLALIEASHHESASEIGHNLFNSVSAFRQTRMQEDDQTVIILKGTK